MTNTTTLYQRIYSLVRCIPPGRLTTYGRLARQVGTTPRVVGFALAALQAGSDVPWQRVINSQGKISRRRDGDGNLLQYELLKAEGICFTDNERVRLGAYLVADDD